MKRILSIAAVLLASTMALCAQQALNNESIIKMAKAGLSDDVIVATVSASAGAYNTSPDSLIALKGAGVSDKVISALIQKSQAAPVPDSNGAAPAPVPAAVSKPRVFLTARSAATTWTNMLHNQTLEMSKDFGQSCPTAVITVNEQAADYTIALHHVETGFFRDNQMQVSTRDGDVIAPPVKFETIAKGVKRACDAIAADWAAKTGRPAVPNAPAPPMN